MTLEIVAGLGIVVSFFLAVGLVLAGATDPRYEILDKMRRKGATPDELLDMAFFMDE